MPRPEIRIIEHLDRQIDALGAKIQDQGIAFEVSGVVGVELDTRFASVDFLGNDTAAGEDVGDFLDRGVEGKVGDVDGGVFALAGFGGGGFGFLGGVDTTACFLFDNSARGQVISRVRQD